MKLEKAIEIATLNAFEEGTYLPPDYVDALKLLIEAGKFVQQERIAYPEVDERRLPGETKE